MKIYCASFTTTGSTSGHRETFGNDADKLARDVFATWPFVYAIHIGEAEFDPLTGVLIGGPLADRVTRADMANAP